VLGHDVAHACCSRAQEGGGVWTASAGVKRAAPGLLRGGPQVRVPASQEDAAAAAAKGNGNSDGHGNSCGNGHESRAEQVCALEATAPKAACAGRPAAPVSLEGKDRAESTRRGPQGPLKGLEATDPSSSIAWRYVS
jgi:hypothetical protein